jgi:hypothetical protein
MTKIEEMMVQAYKLETEIAKDIARVNEKKLRLQGLANEIEALGKEQDAGQD